MALKFIGSPCGEQLALDNGGLSDQFYWQDRIMKKNSFAPGQHAAKKVMILTLAVVMCLAGCGGDKKNGKASPSTNNPDGSSGKSPKSTGGATRSSPGSISGSANPPQQAVADTPAVALHRMFSLYSCVGVLIN